MRPLASQINLLDYFGFMKQHYLSSFAFPRHGLTGAGFVASKDCAAAKSTRFSILSSAFLARALVLGLLLISILR